MNSLLETPGFLGTGASLLADLTLLAYVLLIMPGMILGFIFARQGYHRPRHKWLMIGITVANWALIIFLMMATFLFDVAPNVASQPGNPRYSIPSVHALFGIPAQLLATYIVIRMLIEDYQVARAKARGEKDLSKYWFKIAKPVMRLTLLLWILTASLGIVTYLTRYNVIVLPGTQVVEPVQTPEAVPPPAATEDVPAPASTEETGDDAEDE
jgi:uncharacterized membrane protein YozB (DUF420 family)